MIEGQRRLRIPTTTARLAWPLASLALLLLFDALFVPGFFKISYHDGRLYGSVIDILNRGSPIALLAIGQTLVIATGGIDLSVGAVMALAGTTAACLIARPDHSPISLLPAVHSLFLIGLAGLAVALLSGAWNGLLVVGLELQPIVATLVLMVSGRGVAQLLSNGQIVTFQNATFALLGTGSMFALPIPVLVAVAVLLIVSTLVRGSALGLFIESVGNSRRAARMSGIATRAITLSAYAVSGVCAGVAGLILTADIQSADASNIGLYSELDAILAVSLGGTALTGGRFSLIGSIIGALLIQTLTTTILARGIAPETTLVIKGAVVIAVCLLQSDRARASLGRVFNFKRKAAAA